MSSLCVLLLIPVLLDPVSLLSFYLPANSKKCLHEDIHKDVVARGEYQVTEEPDIKTNLQVTYGEHMVNSPPILLCCKTSDRYFIIFYCHGGNDQ